MANDQLPTAGLLKRLGACMYDGFILCALSMAYWALATTFMVMALGVEANPEYHPMSDYPLISAGWPMSLIAFYWFFWRRGGQTIGMRAWRIKLVDLEGKRRSHLQCLIRLLTAPISFFTFGLGFFWCLIDKQGATAHDRISKTQVLIIPKN